ncbi:Crp/Fnr family transcriptional regulator [Brumimicrobium mesophilum]|uniref:Crp/Fnr family transcriptional regulator n=1 Tax=Brumimicrobium mesophilum TaxID=392717 RepID=UPI000D14148C|nr:Crp/Fnr family transcriptional regulator [Brumimicrobium mesophilum]
MKNTKLWFIDGIELFDELTLDQKMELQSIFKENKYSKNANIFEVDDPVKDVFFVHTGRIKIVKSSDSEKESIKRILNPGDYYGENAAIDPNMFTHHKDTAIVMDKDTVVYSIPLEDFKNICTSNLAINAKVVKNILTNYRRLDNRLTSVMLKKSKNRIIDFIKELAEDIGKPVGYEMLIKHNLTHQEIASITGISRQKVTTILNEFKQDGLIHLERNSILVHDTKLLA